MKTCLLQCLLVFFALYKAREAAAFTLTIPDPEMRGWDQDPLIFHLNSANCPEGIEELLDEAIALWNGVPNSGLRVERGEDTFDSMEQQRLGQSRDVPGIFCVTDMTSAGVDPHSIPGLATGYMMTGPHLSNGFLLLNADPSGQANINRLDRDLVSVVIAHEIGHVLGLGHSEDTAALMYFDASTKKNLALSDDDANGLAYLYPRQELDGADPLMGCGVIGGSGPPGTALFLLLMPALLLLRRRKV